jgi:hypothetical protein
MTTREQAKAGAQPPSSGEAAGAAPTAKPGLFAHLLGVFVIYHLAAVVIQAIPDPGVGLRRSAWREPTVQQEFKVWAEFFSGFGREVTVDELQDRLWALAKGFTEGRAAVAKPFGPYARYVGVRQPWRMFVAPHRFPTALVIDVQEGDTWRVVYADRSPEYTWRARLFSHDRMRAAIFRYGWPGYSGIYRDFSRWIARMAAADFPAASHVRVRMFKRRSPTPEEVREDRVPKGETIFPTTLPLEAWR